MSHSTVSECLLSSYKILDTTFGVCCSPVWLYLNFTTSAKTVFPNKVIFTGTEDEDFSISLFGDTIQSIAGACIRLRSTKKEMHKEMKKVRVRSSRSFTEERAKHQSLGRCLKSWRERSTRQMELENARRRKYEKKEHDNGEDYFFHSLLPLIFSWTHNFLQPR